MPASSIAKKLVDEFRSRPTLRAGSLITTVFGDAIAPRGGTVWVGSLINVMDDFGISERLVRTSVFRLAGDGWLEAESIGRRSYYGLTDAGARQFEQATKRIYGEPRQSWDGQWCIVLLGGVSAVARDSLRTDLGRMGFGQISGSVLAHPSPNDSELRALLDREGALEDVVVLTGHSSGRLQDQRLRTLAQKNWDLDDIAGRYVAFLERFRPAYAALDGGGEPKPRDAFRIRTLLIQEYRKILLRDPLLPFDLLPAGWQGLSAYRLCRNLYRAVYRAADDYLSTTMETAEGPLPPPEPRFYERFGGLAAEAA